ncbi:MAG: endo-1,3-alpha-glucanase family glycosylhydrolase [Sulfolobales archaeon]
MCGYEDIVGRSVELASYVLRGRTLITKASMLGILLIILLILISSSSSYITTSSESLVGGVEVYLYVFIVEVNSDWAYVEFLGGPTVVGYDYTLVKGSGAPGLRYVVKPKSILIGKEPYDQTPVSINFSVIAVRGDDVGLIIIRKGDVGSVNVSMYAWVSGGYMFLWRFTNNGTNPQYPGTNDRYFTADFRQLYRFPACVGVYDDVVRGFNESVLAFYYPWYGVAYGVSSRWFHWEGVTEDSIENTAHYPLLGVYDSWDERLIEAHILLAKYAGVDGFIVSWWGPNSFEDCSLRRVIKIAEKYDFKITIYYESYRPWNPLTSPTDIVKELSYVVREYSRSPSFLKVNGKPVIFIYAVEAHDRGPNFWLRVRKDLEGIVGPIYLIADLRSPSYLYVFDGFHTYIELNHSVMRELYAFYSDWMKISLVGFNFSEAVMRVQAGGEVVIQRKVLFYTVIPGFDNRKISKPGVYVGRDEGRLYQRMWDDALELSVKYVLITSWNELHEGTEVEPTREYGFKYLEMTRDYVSKLKNLSIEGIPQPRLGLTTSNWSKEYFYIKLRNDGGGPAIAVRVELKTPPGVTARLIDPYRQPSRSDVVVIPIIRSYEEYTLTVSVGGSYGDLFNIARLDMQYYSLNGSSYNTEALISVQREFLTVTRTETTTITASTSITTTKTATVVIPSVTTIIKSEEVTKTETIMLTHNITTTVTKYVSETDWTLISVIAVVTFTVGVVVGMTILRRRGRS